MSFASEIRFSPFLSAMGTYDDGLAGISVTDAGQLATSSSFGSTLSWGISGAHSFRNHTRLGLAYNGSANWYTGAVNYNSINHNLMIGVTHQFSRRLELEWRQTAGIATRPYAVAGLVESVPFDPSTAYIPTTDYFDNREIHGMSSLALTYALSKRLSLRLSGAGFLVKRQSSALTSSWGTMEGADAQYRLTGRTTVGGAYQYVHFGFARYGGGTDAHMIQGVYSTRLSRRLELSLYAGVARLESKFIESVPVDPTIAALLGITSTSSIAHFIITTPVAQGRLARSFSRGVVYVTGGRTILPGNGIFLTSVADMVTAGYNYTGFHRWSLNAETEYTRSTAKGAISGEYATLSGGLSAGRQLTRFFGLHCSYRVRQYSSGNYATYNRRIDTVSLGMYFSPGELRLNLW